MSGVRNSCDMFAQELRLERGCLLELDRLAAEQLVLLGDVRGRRLDLPLELVGRLLQLLVELRLLERLAAIVENRDHRVQLAVLGKDLAGDGLDRHRLSRAGIRSGRSRRRGADRR